MPLCFINIKYCEHVVKILVFVYFNDVRVQPRKIIQYDEQVGNNSLVIYY